MSVSFRLLFEKAGTPSWFSKRVPHPVDRAPQELTAKGRKSHLGQIAGACGYGSTNRYQNGTLVRGSVTLAL